RPFACTRRFRSPLPGCLARAQSDCRASGPGTRRPGRRARTTPVCLPSRPQIPWTRQQRSRVGGANSRPWPGPMKRGRSGRRARTSSEEEYPMPPVSIERFLKELEKLKRDMDAGKLKSGTYDQRLARVIQELRERGVDADRSQITAALADAHQRGVITDTVKAHLEKRLGLV